MSDRPNEYNSCILYLKLPLFYTRVCASVQNDLINFYLWPSKGSHTWLTNYKHDTKLNCPKSV